MIKKTDAPAAKAVPQSTRPRKSVPPTLTNAHSTNSDTFTYPQPLEYSRAFDVLVEDADDIVGLLAYALYKQSVRESAMKGVETERTARDLPPATVLAFQSSAEQLITLVVSDAINKATPEIQNAATVARIDTHHADMLSALGREREAIEKHVTTRTSALSAFVVNVIAWVVSLAITVLILNLANQPDVAEVVTQQLPAPGKSGTDGTSQRVGSAPDVIPGDKAKTGD